MRKLQILLFVIFLLPSCSTARKFFKKKKIEKTIKVKKTLITGASNKGRSSYFRDVTKGMGLGGVRATNLYAVDFDNDGYTDLVTLPDFYSIPKFYHYNHEKRIFELLSYNPFSGRYRASYLNFHDFDKDGIVDVLLGTLNQKTELTKSPIRLFRGKKTKGRIKFVEVKNAIAKSGAVPTASVSLLDYDLDGNIDIFQANWFDLTKKNNQPVPDGLLIGKGFKFKDDTSALLGELKFNRDIKTYVNARPTFSSSVCDIDQNGFPDILTSSSGGHQNNLWLNLYSHKHGRRVFKNYGDISLYSQDDIGRLDSKKGGNTFFSLCTDYNNNGIIDILIGEQSHSYDNEYRDRSSFLSGDTHDFPPHFIRSEYVSDEGANSWNRSDRRGVFSDFNNDGLIDILVTNTGFPPRSRLILFEQSANHAFDNIAKDVKIDILNPVGTIILDFDQDGRMDFITGQSILRNASIIPRIFVYQNILERGERKSIRFHLSGKRSNADGLGAKLVLKTDQNIQTRFAEYTSGPQGSQNEKGIHFGLGHNNRMNSITVTWPILKNKLKNPLPLKVHYDLSKLPVEQFLSLTLCENGLLLRGKQECD